MINKELKNRYSILKIIGRGGFGITYLAQDRANANSLCVVKQLNPYHAEITTAKRLFQREKYFRSILPAFGATILDRKGIEWLESLL